MHVCKHQELPSALFFFFLLSLFFKHNLNCPLKWVLLGTAAKNTPMINCLTGLIFEEKKKRCSAVCLPCKFSILWRESVFKQVCPSNYFVNYSLIHPESNPGLFWSSLCWALPVQISELPCSSSCLCWRLDWDAKSRMLSENDSE